jgi:hypothetical protein
MIIQHECGEVVDHNYDFMGRVMHSRRRECHIKHFLKVHHDIQDAESHQKVKDLIEDW